VFVEETGFFRKTYDVILDLPYENIAKIHVEKRNANLTITGTNGQTYDIAFDPATVIAKFLKELMG
jgi:hypothetical protein